MTARGKEIVMGSKARPTKANEAYAGARPLNASEPPHCPECGRLENTVTTCRHCGHEYAEDDAGFLPLIMGLGIVATAVYFLWTMASWFIGDASLVEVLKAQWEWLKNLRVW